MVTQQIHKTGARSAATARRLNATRGIAPHVMNTTFTIDDIPAIKRELPDHVAAYFVRSEVVADRWYCVTYNVLTDTWTSSGGREMLEKHVARVKASKAAA